MPVVLLESLTGWHWLALAVVVLFLRALVGRWLIAPAVAGLAVAIAMALVPLAWPLQLGAFAVVTLIAGGIYWRWLRPPPLTHTTKKLHKRKARLLGMRASLMAPIKAGRGTVQLQDALWPVTCGEDLPAGTLVEITGYDKNILHVSRASLGRR